MNRPDSSNQRRSNRPGSTSRPASGRATPSKVEQTSGASTPAPATPAKAVVETGAVVTRGLCKRYGDAEALAPLDLRIADGQRVTLIGHNGSGKTTLLRMLTGMLEATTGTATVAGHPIASVEARAAVSYLSDQPVFYDDLSVWEHLEYIARLHGTDDWEQQAVDVVEMVGLTARVDDLPMTFSRGLKQKAAIAMAFVRPFDVMLVDEPFVGLDQVGREALLELFALAHGDGATLVVATHELSTVKLSDRLIALSSGQVTYDGSPDGADVVMLSEGVHPGDG
ncbi:MAG: ABC transporter ATP-binding protein [Ilumatobacteraceae bacterium]